MLLVSVIGWCPRLLGMLWLCIVSYWSNHRGLDLEEFGGGFLGTDHSVLYRLMISLPCIALHFRYMRKPMGASEIGVLFVLIPLAGFLIWTCPTLILFPDS